MMKKIFLLMILMLAIPIVSAIQPTQQSNKMLLSPFYVNAMTAGVQYNYTISTVVPDGISEIKTAIITVDAWINPTRTFNAWMNGVQCNTKNYTISTTYAGAGRGVVTLDCTNAVLPMIDNTVTFVVTGGNIGSSTAWIDLTYMTNPTGDVAVHGTEYYPGDDGKVWLQLLNANGTHVSEGVCFVDIYTPDNQEYIERAQMDNLLHDGIYYYDLVIPSTLGVYPTIAKCYYQATSVLYYPNTTSYTMITGTAVDTTPISDIQTQDGTFWRFSEATDGVNRRLNMTLDFVNASTCSQVDEALLTGINIHTYAKFDSAVNDNINFEIYNWSGGNWVTLPNVHLEGPPYRSTSNTIETNNVTKSGFYNSTTQSFRIRIIDSAITDGANDNLDIDQIYLGCNQLSNPIWQTVMGSSEIHVNQIPSIQIVSDIWNATNRTLTSYPPQIDMTNYTQITSIVNTSALDIKTNVTGKLDSMDIKLDNILSAFTNIASNVWNFASRYIHGELI